MGIPDPHLGKYIKGVRYCFQFFSTGLVPSTTPDPTCHCYARQRGSANVVKFLRYPPFEEIIVFVNFDSSQLRSFQLLSSQHSLRTMSKFDHRYTGVEVDTYRLEICRMRDNTVYCSKPQAYVSTNSDLTFGVLPRLVLGCLAA